MNCENCENYIPTKGYRPGDRFELKFESSSIICLLIGINGKYRLVNLVNGGFPGEEIDVGTSCSLPLNKSQIVKLTGNATEWACVSRRFSEPLYPDFHKVEK